MQYDKDFQSLKKYDKIQNMYIFRIWWKHMKPGREVFKVVGRMKPHFKWDLNTDYKSCNSIKHQLLLGWYIGSFITCAVVRALLNSLFKIIL